MHQPATRALNRPTHSRPRIRASVVLILLAAPLAGCGSRWLLAGGYTAAMMTEGTTASGWTAAAGSVKDGEGVTGSVQAFVDHLDLEDASRTTAGAELVMLLHTFRALGFSFGFGWAGHRDDGDDWGTGPVLNLGMFRYLHRGRGLMLHLGARGYWWAGETDSESDTGARGEVMLRLVGVL